MLEKVVEVGVSKTFRPVRDMMKRVCAVGEIIDLSSQGQLIFFYLSSVPSLPFYMRIRIQGGADGYVLILYQAIQLGSLAPRSEATHLSTIHTCKGNP